MSGCCVVATTTTTTTRGSHFFTWTRFLGVTATATLLIFFTFMLGAEAAAVAPLGTQARMRSRPPSAVQQKPPDDSSADPSTQYPANDVLGDKKTAEEEGPQVAGRYSQKRSWLISSLYGFILAKLKAFFWTGDAWRDLEVIVFCIILVCFLVVLPQARRYFNQLKKLRQRDDYVRV